MCEGASMRPWSWKLQAYFHPFPQINKENGYLHGVTHGSLQLIGLISREVISPLLGRGKQKLACSGDRNLTQFIKIRQITLVFPVLLRRGEINFREICPNIVLIKRRLRYKTITNTGAAIHCLRRNMAKEQCGCLMPLNWNSILDSYFMVTIN